MTETVNDVYPTVSKNATKNYETYSEFAGMANREDNEDSDDLFMENL